MVQCVQAFVLSHLAAGNL